MNVLHKIADSTFLMVCSGETYSSFIIKGYEILDKMQEEMYGDDKMAGKEEMKMYGEELANIDNWHNDQDFGPVRYNTEVGETDHIELIRIISFK